MFHYLEKVAWFLMSLHGSKICNLYVNLYQYYNANIFFFFFFFFFSPGDIFIYPFCTLTHLDHRRGEGSQPPIGSVHLVSYTV